MFVVMDRYGKIGIILKYTLRFKTSFEPEVLLNKRRE